MFCALYLSEERLFPFWDYAAYQDQTYAVADAFGRSFGDGVALVAASMNDDYNKLLTVPLVPLVGIFGESRMVYIWDVVIVYFIPFLLVVAAIARRVFPERAREATIAAVVMAILTPLTWRNILDGYADISGAVLIGAMILLYDRSEHGLRWRPMLVCGVCAALAILLRRHYIYPDFAFYAAFFADAIVTALRSKWNPQQWIRALVTLAGSGIVALVVLTVVAPQFVQRITNPAYGQYFAPWQTTPDLIFFGMLTTIGVPMLLLAVAGTVLLPRVTVAGRGLARIIVVGTVVWAAVWVLFVRQGATHYPHALPFFMAIGLTALWLHVRTLSDHVLRFAASSAIALILVFATLVAIPMTQPMVALGSAMPAYATPYIEAPHVNPAYAEVTRLVYFLRAQAGPSDHVVVAASSKQFNWDLLREAERTLFGPSDTKLTVDNTPQFDSTGEPPPADALSHAKFVLVAQPFQHHLPAEQQKLVHVLAEAFDQHWKAADDFRLLAERFELEPGVTLRVYERVRPASVATALDTQARMVAYVRRGGASRPLAAGGGWVEASSAYAVTVNLNDDGSSTIFANPAREDQQPKTIMIHPEDTLDDVRISGSGRLLDARCAGAQVLFGTEYRGAKLTVPTIFAPREPAKGFDVLVRHVHGNPIYMKVDHAAASPRDIDYCTLALERVAVRRAGGVLDARTARALRSDVDPFAAAAAPAAAGSRATAAASPATDAARVAWIRKSSPFPMDIAPGPNGTFVFSGHPARDGQQPETVIEFGPTPLKSVRLSGLVRFYTPQCKGAQIVAGTNYGSTSPTTAVGVFTPTPGGSRFDTVVPDTSGKTVYLNFKGNPRDPQDIDYCTLRIEDLRAGPA